MRRFAPALCAAALLLPGCGQAHSEAATAKPVPKTASEIPSSVAENMDDAVVRFSDILAQYQSLNARLEDVAARLQIANAELCPRTRRDPGFTAHTLSDYPARLQQVAKTLLRVDGGLSVRTVRAGSPAQIAGLQKGDALIGVNGQRFASGPTQQMFYDRATEAAFETDIAKLTIARGDEVLTLDMAPQTLCGYPAHVVFDETVNGHTDGDSVWITSELMRTVEDDVNLALIVAHEMSHAIDRHVELTPMGEARKALELRADRAALVMLARAGFDIDRAIAYWTRADNPQRLSQSRSDTHPSISERLANFEIAKRAIDGAKQRGEPLDFSIIK